VIWKNVLNAIPDSPLLDFTQLQVAFCAQQVLEVPNANHADQVKLRRKGTNLPTTNVTTFLAVSVTEKTMSVQSPTIQ
jgi:hypothetical protein